MQTGQAPPKHGQESSRSPLTCLLGVQRDNPPQASSVLGGAVQMQNFSPACKTLTEAPSGHAELKQEGCPKQQGLNPTSLFKSPNC